MKREWGIDLLKIVAMLFIVADHIVSWGGWGLCSEQTGLKGLVLNELNGYCLVAVNCFVLASGWVMCRKEFKIGRILKLWCEVEFYGLLVLLVCKIAFPEVAISSRDWLFCLLPLTMNRYWFFTQYVGLFFLMPILNAAINNLSRKQLIVILSVGFALLVFHPFFFKNDMFIVHRGYSVLWFAYLYLLAGTISVHRILIGCPTWGAAVCVVVGGFGSYWAILIVKLVNQRLGLTTNLALFDAYNSPFLLLGSVSMLLLFQRLRIENKLLIKAISFVAQGVFSVYVIHSHRYFRVMTNWNETWTRFLSSHGLVACLGVVIVTTLAIFFGCVIIDALRRNVKRMIFK